MKKVISASIVMFLLAVVSISAQPMGDGAGMFHKNIKAMLKLTPEQEKQFDDITYKQQQVAIEIRAKIQHNRLDLKKMIDDKTLDGGKVLQLTDENSKLQGELKHNFVQRWLDIYRILNDDQKDMFMKGLSKIIDSGMIRERMGMRQGMMGRGMGMRGNGMRGSGMMWHQGMNTDQTPQPTNTK